VAYAGAWTQLEAATEVLDALDISALTSDVLNSTESWRDLPVGIAGSITNRLLVEAHPESRASRRILGAARLTGYARDHHALGGLSRGQVTWARRFVRDSTSVPLAGPTQHGSRAAIDASGGHLAVAGVHRLQVVDYNQISAYYLALVLGGSWNDRFQVGSAVSRADIRLLEVPLVSTDEQVNVNLADDAAKLLLESGTQMLEHAAALRASMLDALRYNVPLPGDDQ
jgi:hypothetical protein